MPGKWISESVTGGLAGGWLLHKYTEEIGTVEGMVERKAIAMPLPNSRCTAPFPSSTVSPSWPWLAPLYALASFLYWRLIPRPPIVSAKIRGMTRPMAPSEAKDDDRLEEQPLTVEDLYEGFEGEEGRAARDLNPCTSMRGRSRLLIFIAVVSLLDAVLVIFVVLPWQEAQEA